MTLARPPSPRPPEASAPPGQPVPSSDESLVGGKNVRFGSGRESLLAPVCSGAIIALAIHVGAVASRSGHRRQRAARPTDVTVTFAAPLSAASGSSAAGILKQGSSTSRGPSCSRRSWRTIIPEERPPEEPLTSRPAASRG
jgi:hypothetical protein